MRATGSKSGILSGIQQAGQLRREVGDRASCKTGSQANGAGIAAASTGSAEILDEREKSHLELICDPVIGLGGVRLQQQLVHGIADGIGAQLDARSCSSSGATRYRRVSPIHGASVGRMVVPPVKDVGVVPKREMINPWLYRPGWGSARSHRNYDQLPGSALGSIGRNRSAR